MNLASCENALARLQSAGKNQLQAVQHYFARRDLEANLATLLDAARGHEAHSVPRRIAQYFVLHQQSERLINGYCQRWQVTPGQLNAELPALERLRQLAQPSLRKTPMDQSRSALFALYGCRICPWHRGSPHPSRVSPPWSCKMMLTILGVQSALLATMAPAVNEQPYPRR